MPHHAITVIAHALRDSNIAQDSKVGPAGRGQVFAEIGFRKAVPPEPKRFAQCRNCKHIAYDSDDRCNLKGELTLRRVNLRCSQHRVPVRLGTVCDTHEFAYSDRADR